MRLVEFDRDRADDGANAPYAKPEEQLFNDIVGEQNNRLAAPYAALLQITGNIGRDLIELCEIDFRLLMQVNDGRFVRVAPAKRSQ